VIDGARSSLQIGGRQAKSRHPCWHRWPRRGNMCAMDRDELIESVLGAWRRHHDILMGLLDAVPRGGMAALPSESRGRDVSRVFFHMDRVRRGWVHMHQTGKRPDLPRADDGKRPTKAQLRKALKASNKEVEAFLEEALTGVAKVRMFGKDPVRWMAYLISHESHHRGQIAMALKQSGQRLDEEQAIGELWGTWIRGA